MGEVPPARWITTTVIGAQEAGMWLENAKNMPRSRRSNTIFVQLFNCLFVCFDVLVTLGVLSR